MRKGSIGAFLSVVVVLLALVTEATAQDECGSTAREAMALTEQAREAYRHTRLEEAVSLLDQAFELCPHPIIVFNRGRAHQELGELRAARTDFRLYLQMRGDASDRAEVERRLAIVEAGIADEEALAAATLRAEEEAAAARARAEEARRLALEADARSARSDPAPWILGAGGLLALGVAGGFGIAALVDADVPPEADHLAASRAEQEAQLFALVANVGFAAGGALVLAGAIWGIVVLSTGASEQTSDAAAARLSIGVGRLDVLAEF